MGSVRTVAIASAVFLLQAAVPGRRSAAEAAAQASPGAQPAAATHAYDVYVPSLPENVAWGAFPVDKKPVARVRSGQRVRIDTISHQGSTQDENPVTYLGKLGVKEGEILKDVLEFWASRAGRPEGSGGHVLTGPIYVEDAEPGDTLEVQILALTPRVPYGINSTGPTSGVFRATYGTQKGEPSLSLPGGPAQHLIRTGKVNGKDVALFSDTIHVPINPFMGIMAVVPKDAVMGELGVKAPGLQGSGPPGPYGGNMDFRTLTIGTKLFLPVFQSGALFYTGDPHLTQGDGEVSGNALEQSLTGTFRFVVHKKMTITAPRAETSTDYLLLGIDADLNQAMRMATWEVINFLVKEKGLSASDAFSLASIGVDFRVAEAVDGRQVIAGRIPKKLFASTR
jgi:acetamidase/formamidase